MHSTCPCLRAKQVCRTYLNTGSPQVERSANPVGIRNPARSNHRNANSTNNLRQQGKGANLGRQVTRKKHSPMATRLKALRNDGIHPLPLQP